MTSEELYRRCVDNDEQAWAYTYNYVNRFLKKTAAKDEEVEDITHDTLYYFLDGGLERIKNPLAFKQLLRLKARGVFIDRYRYRIARRHEPLYKNDEFDRPMGENPGITSVDSRVDEALFIEKALKVLKKTLESIGSECKTLIERYFRARFMGENVSEIAKELGKPENTVRVNIYRCHQKLTRQAAYRRLLDDLSG